MVARLVQLRLGELANTFGHARRGLPLRIAAWLLVAVSLGIVLALVLGNRMLTAELARTSLTVLGTAIGLGFVLMPLAFGADTQFDPRRFQLFGIGRPRLAFGLAVTGIVTVPVALLVVVLGAQFVVWMPDPLAAFVAVLGGLLFIVLCVLSTRVCSGIATLALSSRRARDVAGISVVAVVGILAPVAMLLGGIDWEGRAIPVLRRVAAVAQWTPFGATWAAPGDVALGDVPGAFGRLGIAVAGIVVLAALWYLVVVLTLAKRDRMVSERVRGGLGWFARVPATPSGAIAARSLSYWARDRRYAYAVAVVPVVPIVLVVALLVAGVPVGVVEWVPVPVMCLFLGWVVHNDLAHDSTAFWSHVAANVSGRADRWGRVVPGLVIGIPLALGGSVVTAVVTGNWTGLPALAGLSLCVLCAALGAASVASAAFPYPTAQPGDSPFAQPQSTGGGSAAQLFGFVVPIVFAAPVVWLIVLWFGQGLKLSLLAGGIALGIGLIALAGGILLGGWILSRRAPELLSFTLQN